MTKRVPLQKWGDRNWEAGPGPLITMTTQHTVYAFNFILYCWEISHTVAGRCDRACHKLLINKQQESELAIYVDPVSSERGALTIHSSCVRGTLSGVASSFREPSGNVDSRWIRVQSKG
jgi:hypothetical protein